MGNMSPFDSTAQTTCYIMKAKFPAVRTLDADKGLMWVFVRNNRKNILQE